MTEECDHKGHKVICPSSAGPCCEGCGEPWPYENSKVSNKTDFLGISESLREYTEIDEAEGANAEVVSAAYAASKAIIELTEKMEKLQIENKNLKIENGILEEENNELNNQPWPEWARAVLKVIRSGSGYDGYDDATEGVDVPNELSEHLSELERMIEIERNRADSAELLMSSFKIDDFKRDAKRYQYLRDNHSRIWSGIGGKGYSVDIGFEGKGDDLGAAIDEAMKMEGY